MNRQPPSTYAEWVDCFKMLRDEQFDEEMLPILEEGQFDYHLKVGEKFVQQVYLLFNDRLQNASDRFQEQMKWAQTEVELGKAIFNLRSRLAVLHQLASIPAFKKHCTETLLKYIDDYAQKTQSSLEDSAKNDMTGRLTLFIQQNSIIRFKEVEGKMKEHQSTQSKHSNITKDQGGTILKRTKRRVILL